MTRPLRQPRSSSLEGRVLALLGPTNTGKTHRAVEQMLGHPSGMIGLPLRLLAREVYDRITARVGERAVALITGEEKRIPADPAYFVCTVESMPVDRRVAFLAVDEIQLAGHRLRGHVFTDRLLHARGDRTTMFLGADTAAPLVQRLVPEARIERPERFSTLRYAPPRRLQGLPPRSAVIAFSAADVYHLAAELRDRVGGAAVVLGALSPRTRNAQVAMYQAGEVPYMVATDAIGMGLNLDLDRVVFASLTKFDGIEHRELTPAEIGQIAGRAGRYRRGGWFGGLSAVGDFPPGLIDAVEGHRFAPLRRLYWRNPELEFSSLDGLLDSLQQPPPRDELELARHGRDGAALRELAGEDAVRAIATDRDRVRQLWEVCQIPDYGAVDTHVHARQLAEIHAQLVSPAGRLGDDWLDARVRRVERTDGDLETLMTRIAQVRIWSYVAYRPAWVADAEGWQARTAAAEDALSDAIHEQLAERFVDRRAVVLLRELSGAGGADVTVGEDGAVRADGQRLGRLEGLEFRPARGLEAGRAREVRRAARALLQGAVEERVEQIVRAPYEDFTLDDTGQVRWQGAALARLAPGRDVLSPEVRVPRSELAGAGARRRIERRLVAWSRDLVADLLAPLRRPVARALGPAARGVVYLLEQGLGTAARADASRQLRELGGDDRRHLARLDVRLGTRHVYVASLLDPEAVARRAVLAGVFAGLAPPPVAPYAGEAAVAADAALPDEVYRAMGYPRVGALAVRTDVLEEIAAAIRRAARRGAFAADPAWSARLGATDDELASLLEALGYRRARGGGLRFVRARRPRGAGRPRSRRGQG